MSILRAQNAVLDAADLAMAKTPYTGITDDTLVEVTLIDEGDETNNVHGDLRLAEFELACEITGEQLIELRLDLIDKGYARTGGIGEQPEYRVRVKERV